MLKKDTEQKVGLSRRSKPVDRIVLTGFRATGKSVVGKRLAEVLGYRFLDTDRELAAAMQCGIDEYVGRHGWAAFRELERRLLAKLAGKHQLVIATGGGSIMHRLEWRRLRKNSLVVWLTADAGTIRHRLRHDGVSAVQRPSLTGDDVLAEVDRMLAEREPFYRQGSDVAIDTTGRSPETMVSLIKAMLSRKDNEG
jgi:shikimate kinase